jgi:hypothetical protein
MSISPSPIPCRRTTSKDKLYLVEWHANIDAFVREDSIRNACSRLNQGDINTIPNFPAPNWTLNGPTAEIEITNVATYQCEEMAVLKDACNDDWICVDYVNDPSNYKESSCPPGVPRAFGERFEQPPAQKMPGIDEILEKNVLLLYKKVPCASSFVVHSVSNSLLGFV